MTGYSIAIADSILSGNTAGSARTDNTLGGGVFLRGTIANIERSIVSQNSAGQSGGGIYVEAGGFRVAAIELSSCVVAENSAGARTSTFGNGKGGGIYLGVFVGHATIDGTTFVDNFASDTGGGLYLSSARLTLTNSTMSENSARFGGGLGGSASLEQPTVIRHSTIANNEAFRLYEFGGLGGGILVQGQLASIEHSIVAGNHSDSSTSPDFFGTVVVGRFNLIGDNRGSNLKTEAPVGSPDANGNLIGGPVHGVIDPLLGPLTNNGGPTPTHALLPGSPAIDAGDASLRPGIGATPEFDQRGTTFSRVVGARIDIGAVEQTGVPLIVDTLIDESDGDYRRGDLSLREAIELANSQPGPDEIRFDPALFAPGPRTILLTHGELAITDSLTITGPGADLLTIDASGNDPTPDVNNGDGSRIFNIYGGKPTRIFVSLAHQTFTGGDSSSGGAIWSGENLEVLDCLILNNSATGDGGGIAAYTFESTTTIRHTRIIDNVAGQSGGGIALSAFSNSAIRITDVLISKNLAQLSGGGATLYASVSSAFIANSVIEENVVTGNGGGLAIYATVLGSTTVQNSIVTGNRAGFGAGVFMYSQDDESVLGGVATILQCTITNNTASLTGGGIYAVSNTASAKPGEGGSIVIRQSTITGNTKLATSPFLFFGSAGVSLIQYGDGLVTLDHSIVAGNFRGNTDPSDLFDFYGATISHNLIGSSLGTSLTEAPVGTPDVNGNLIGGPIHGTIDPLLAPLADNGGPTPTHALLPGSPAIGAGDSALVPGIGGVPEFDQRGAPFTRLAGARIDIGAFESQSANGALNADFDLNAQVDGSDFLLWQRNLGKTSGATLRQGDATADGDVDGNDLAVWRARFGAAAATVPSANRQTPAAGQTEATPTGSHARLAGAALLVDRGAPSVPHAPQGRSAAATTSSLHPAFRPTGRDSYRNESFGSDSYRSDLYRNDIVARDAALQSDDGARAATLDSSHRSPRDETVSFASSIDAALGEAFDEVFGETFGWDG